MAHFCIVPSSPCHSLCVRSCCLCGARVSSSMADEGDLPYKTEYAKSNRASCKACKGIISKETLRMARMVQSPHFDGKVHHSVMLLSSLECAQVLSNGSDSSQTSGNVFCSDSTLVPFSLLLQEVSSAIHWRCGWVSQFTVGRPETH